MQKGLCPSCLVYRDGFTLLIKTLTEYFAYKDNGPKTKHDFLEESVREMVFMFDETYGKPPVLKIVKK